MIKIITKLAVLSLVPILVLSACGKGKDKDKDEDNLPVIINSSNEENDEGKDEDADKIDIEDDKEEVEEPEETEKTKETEKTEKEEVEKDKTDEGEVSEGQKTESGDNDKQDKLEKPSDTTDKPKGNYVTTKLDKVSTYEYTITYNNDTNQNLGMGRAYSLQVFTNGAWVNVPYLDDVTWMMDYNTIDSNKSATESINLKSVFGELAPGKYKLVKELSSDNSHFNVTTDFTIQ